MALDENDAVDRLKGELYSRTNHRRVTVGDDMRSPLSSDEPDVPHAWAPPEPPKEEHDEPVVPPIARLMQTKKGWSWSAKFLAASFVFFMLAAGIAGYMFFGNRNTISPDNIDVSILAPSVIDGGKPAELQVVIGNRNKAALQLADLLVDYPDGTRSTVDPTQTLTHERYSIGTINSGSQLKRSLEAQFYGQQGAQQTVHVTLEYTIDGSNSVFQKSGDVSFVVGSSPVAVSVTAPSEAISGQEFAMDLTVAASGVAPINDVVIQGQFPAGFSLSSSSPSAVAGGTFWRLGTLSPGSPAVIHLSGTLLGQDGDQRVFRFFSGSDSNPTDVTVAVPFISVPTTIAIRQPFITASIALNGQSNKTVAVSPGDTITGVVSWQNNLPTPVTNATLKLSLMGAMLDPKSVTSADGFYQSSDNSITWSAQTNPGLASIPAGGKGSETFTFAPQSGQPNTYINPTIDLALTISGTRPSDSGAPTDVSSAATARVAVTSQASLLAASYHFSGPFKNGGPMPPKVGQNTGYTITWTVKNPSNSIANAQVTTTLPPYVAWVGGEDGVTFDPASRTVTWAVGDIRPGVGYSSPADDASFQIALTPSLSQLGQILDLTGQTSFSGQDRFTQTGVTLQAPAPSTKLVNDSGFTASMSTVSQ